ncbi:MAG: hypothetical protein JNL96_22825 [Planctomycetaceae bacterium]|nr:hypothetical protein [Planctomycetaceae bacterium]
MHKVKIFKSVESELNSLESQINAWLGESGARVVQIFGNIAPQSIVPTAKSAGLSTTEFAPSDVLVVVLYETGH